MSTSCRSRSPALCTRSLSPSRRDAPLRTSPLQLGPSVPPKQGIVALSQNAGSSLDAWCLPHPLRTKCLVLERAEARFLYPAVGTALWHPAETGRLCSAPWRFARPPSRSSVGLLCTVGASLPWLAEASRVRVTPSTLHLRDSPRRVRMCRAGGSSLPRLARQLASAWHRSHIASIACRSMQRSLCAGGAPPS